MSDRFCGTLDFPAWALEIPEAKKALVKYFGEPDTWEDTWEMEKDVDIIHLMDPQASYGEFPDIQDCFRKNGIPYDHWSESYSEYDALTEHFRPELKDVVTCDGQDRFILYADDIEKILDSPNLKQELQKLLPPKYKSLHEYNSIQETVGKGDLIDVPIEGLYRALCRYDESLNGKAVCGDWHVYKNSARDCHLDFMLGFNGKHVVQAFVSDDISSSGSHFIDLHRIGNISDNSFSQVCDIVKSVYMFARLAPKEQARIDANNQAQIR